MADETTMADLAEEALAPPSPAAEPLSPPGPEPDDGRPRPLLPGGRVEEERVCARCGLACEPTGTGQWECPAHGVTASEPRWWTVVPCPRCDGDLAGTGLPLRCQCGAGAGSAEDLDALREHRRNLEEFGVETAYPRAEPLRVDYVVPGVIARRDVHMPYGASESGKTNALAVDLPCSVATGLPWLGRETVPGRVVVVVGEDDEARYRQRVAAWAADRGADPWPNLVAVWRAPQLAVDSGVGERFAAFCRAVGPSLVVVDSLSACMEEETALSDANCRTFMGAMRRVAETGAAVMFTHHPTKTGKEPFGFGDLTNQADVTWRVHRVRDGVSRLTPQKQRHDALEPIDFGLARTADGVPLVVPVGEPVDEGRLKACAFCDAPFEASRMDAKYCGATCRKAASRRHT